MNTPEPSEAARWLSRFADALSAGQSAAAADLFAPNGLWRDLLTFTWNITTVEGRDAIAAMLAETLPATAPASWRVTEDEGGQAWFTFETEVARGRGLVRMSNGKAVTLLTAMTELKGHEEKCGPTRPQGLRHGARKGEATWAERRQAEADELGISRQPSCVIIGGGQGGIALGARLRQLDVPTVILETNPRPGDSWRRRYRSLVLHDPVWYDHLPYIPFPDHWPVFAPKDQMGDWLEMYAKVMELNYWGSSTCLGAAFDEDTGKWRVSVDRDGERRELTPDYLVLATGAYGLPNIVDFPGADTFAGAQLHTSDYQSGAAFAGKRSVVIGSGSSAHDVAADLWAHDAQVTMIQRSPTIVVRSESLMEIAFGPLYSQQAVERGITVEKADMLVASLPLRMMADAQRPVYAAIAERDADFYAGLEAAGFRTDFGEDGSGLMTKAMRTASGYYIDVGASQLIIDGAIAVKSGVEIERISKQAVHFADGSAIPADVIVHATGYSTPQDTIAQLINPQVAEKVGPFWGYGSGTRGDPGPWVGELRNMWKPTAQKNLWFHGGNLALSRFYSRHVALQIKARMEGIATPVYRG